MDVQEKMKNKKNINLKVFTSEAEFKEFVPRLNYGWFQIVSNVSRFKPALNLNRVLPDLIRDLNSLNSASGSIDIGNRKSKFRFYPIYPDF